MSVVPLSDEDFDNNGNLNVLKDKNVIVLFYASYCPACNQFKPTFMKASEEVNDDNIVFATVHTPEQRSLMSRLRAFPFSVNYIPTVVSYNKGKYYSTYDYDESNPQDRKTYRTKEDVKEYAKGIGVSEVKTK
jgi:thiol-disulfide isomerase/thioredoxin